MENQNLIVFDMDGVLVDVSRSYRETVRETVRLFFQIGRLSETLPRPLFPLSDLAMIKQRGGLNNDWDLSCFIINLLFQVVGDVTLSKSKVPLNRYRETIRRCEITMLSEFLGSTELPLQTLMARYGTYRDPFIYSLYEGDVGQGNIIKQIFQEIYLGTTFFRSTYGMAPHFQDSEGFIHREKLLIEKADLSHLTRTHTLAIATGRPRAEAAYPLDFHNIRAYFRSVYCLEDCLDAEAQILENQGKVVSLSKPNPYMLDSIAREQKQRHNTRFYVGDMPDDMVAARRSRAKYRGIGFVGSAPDRGGLRKALLKAGAELVVEDFGGLLQIISPSA